MSWYLGGLGLGILIGWSWTMVAFEHGWLQ